MTAWQTMETVPRDGTSVWLWAKDADPVGPHEARWEPETRGIVSTKPGIWVCWNGAFTWCDERADGAPTHWTARTGERPPVPA